MHISKNLLADASNNGIGLQFKKIQALLFLIIMICTPAFSNSQHGTKQIPYTIAKNYFVKNNFVPQMLTNHKIETPEAFNLIFGEATTMGDQGKPTVIDFKKQYVIAVIPPATQYSTSIAPVRLVKSAKNILLTYHIKKGEKTSYTSQPCLILIINSEYKGNIKLIEK
jgi:hypothetical protein